MSRTQGGHGAAEPWRTLAMLREKHWLPWLGSPCLRDSWLKSQVTSVIQVSPPQSLGPAGGKFTYSQGCWPRESPALYYRAMTVKTF